MEQLNQFTQAIMPYVLTIVSAVAGYVALKVKSKFEERMNQDTKRQIIEDTVKYVQQVYGTLDGATKLKKALQTATQWLNEKGINITEAEATILIEAAVKGFKDSWEEKITVEVIEECQEETENN